jgi:hypothetical protein
MVKIGGKCQPRANSALAPRQPDVTVKILGIEDTHE